MNKEKFIELCKCGETSHVQFKQEFTSQVKIAQEMVAFANSSGIVRAMKENVIIDFINEEETNQFRVIIWRTTQKDVIDAQKAEFTTQRPNGATLRSNSATLRSNSATSEADKVASSDANSASLDANSVSLDANSVSSDANSASSEVNETKRRIKREDLWLMINKVCEKWISLEDIVSASGLSYSYIRNVVVPRMIKEKRLVMMYPDTPNHPKQQYKIKE